MKVKLLLGIASIALTSHTLQAAPTSIRATLPPDGPAVTGNLPIYLF